MNRDNTKTDDKFSKNSLTSSSKTRKELKFNKTESRKNTIKGIIYLIAFLASATTLQFSLRRTINKSLFNFISIINIAQIEFSLFVLMISRKLNILKFNSSLSIRKCKKYFPLALVFILLIYTGNAPYYSQSITSNSTIKRLSVIPGMLGQMIMLNIFPSIWEVLACSIIVIGSILMGLNDSLETFSLVLSLVNVIFAAGYNILVHLYCKGENPIELLYYMNMLSLPFYAIATIIEVLIKGRGFIISFRIPSFYFEFFISMSTAIIYNICAFFSNKYNRPLTIIVAGNAKNVIVVIVELWYDSSARFNKGFLYFFGVGTAALGSFLYGIEKFRLNNMTKKEENGDSNNKKSCESKEKEKIDSRFESEFNISSGIENSSKNETVLNNYQNLMKQRDSLSENKIV